GALLPGSVARTDLISPEQTEPLARALYRSVRENLFSLPDDIVVYPTHGTGTTFCAAAPGGPRATTTIGEERASNPLFAAPDEDAFVEQLIAGYGSYPSYFSRLRAVNQRGPRLYGEHPPVLETLSVTKVREMMEHGAEVIDARPIGQFAAGHIPGSLSNELRPAFATWLGWLVPDQRPLIFVLNDDQDRADVVRQSLKIGYENIAGELSGGMAAWRQASFEEDLITLVSPRDLRRDLGQIIDVRQMSEFAQSHIASALTVELGSLGQATPALSAGPITVMCGHGERAMTAASLLARSGRSDLSVLLGGPDDVPKAMLAWA
ncbi:MAG TPA: rhodanese-like domain-containing protein, partial [Actinomycetota bacterium]|nr:rhodanese-like domain-containing protein [Actinomycetota bacterium]